MLFASIWDSFLAQASVLLLCHYTVTLSRGEGPDLFLQSGPFQNFQKFFQELTSSQYCRSSFVIKAKNQCIMFFFQSSYYDPKYFVKIRDHDVFNITFPFFDFIGNLCSRIPTVEFWCRIKQREKFGSSGWSDNRKCALIQKPIHVATKTSSFPDLETFYF